MNSMAKCRALLLASVGGLAMLAGCVERRDYPAASITPAPAQPPAPETEPVKALRIASGTNARRAGFVQYAQRTTVQSDLPGEPAAASDPTPVTLNLTDVPLEAMAEKVLGDLLRSAYVVETELPGVATLRTPEPLPRRAVLGLFERLLAARGAALIWQDGSFRIVAADPNSPALRTAPLDGGGLAAGVGYATRAVRLRHVAPSQMAGILSPLGSEGAVRAADDASQTLVLAGSQAELAELERLVALFDVDWLAGQSVGILPLRYADPVAVAEELLFAVAPEGSATRIVPVKRARALLVVSPSATVLRRVREFLPHLDVPAGDERALFLYPVQNRSAAELADLVTRVFADDGQARTPADTATEDSDIFGGESGGISVVADEAGNALILRARPELHDQALAIIQRLDSVPNQVLLEVTIAEVTLGDELRYGLEYFLRLGDFRGEFTGNPLGIVAPAAPGLSLLLSGTNGSIVLNALAEISDLNIISSPSLMVVDNRTATLQVGDQVPIITQSAVDVSDPDAPIVNSVSYRDTGVTMQVTPRVSDNGLVLLEIAQDVSDVVPTTTSGIDSPTIRQRLIETTVAVNDGESLVLGGLIRDSQGKSVRGIPLFMDIPIAGELFKTTEDNAGRTELLVMITPRVVRNRAEARQVTEELRRRLISLQPLALK